MRPQRVFPVPARCVVVGFGLVAVACGTVPPTAPWPTVPEHSASSEAASGPMRDANGSEQTPSGSTVLSSAFVRTAPPSVPLDMKPPRPSFWVADLRALGLDATHLPSIERVDPRALRAVMKLMAKSLGVKCAYCHQEGDFAAPTRRKKIAARMWDDFAVKLFLTDGSPLFCDSCHQGRVVQLDRSDEKRLSLWMDDNFVAKLARKDGQSHECATCHVDMKMRFLSDWAR
jgi:cytochrome c7-like protein